MFKVIWSGAFLALVIMLGVGCEDGESRATGSDSDSDSDTDSDTDADSDSDTDTDTDTAQPGTCEAYAQGNNLGSVGCEFVIPTPAFFNNSSVSSSYRGPCFAVMVANDSDSDANLTLSRGGTSYTAHDFARIPTGLGSSLAYDPIPSTGIPPHEVAILFLSHNPGTGTSFGDSLECPVTPAVTADTAATATDRGTSFMLESDVPISLYDIIPYGGALSYLPSASLLFPSTSWGTNYTAFTPHNGTQQMWLLFTAAEDNTSVDLLTYASVTGSTTVTAPTPGQSANYNLNAGEFIQLSSSSSTFSGTILSSDKPIGVYTGDTYLSVSTSDCPSGGPNDSAHQQIPHIQALGSEYVGAGIPTRLATMQNESVLYRITGVVGGTILTWHPFAPPGAPTSLDAGIIAEFQSTAFFSVSSQDDDHPFSLTQYMSGDIDNCLGGCFDGGQSCQPGGQGDTDWIHLVPPAQFYNQYSFFTDPTYGITSISLVRVAGTSGFADVEVECIGVVSGWQPLGTSGQYEVAHIDLYRGGVDNVNSCATSQHSATSDEPFGLVVWGTDRDASYAYPAGGGAAQINDVEVPIE